MRSNHISFSLFFFYEIDEIITLFEPTMIMNGDFLDSDLGGQSIRNYMALNVRIYTPIDVVRRQEDAFRLHPRGTHSDLSANVPNNYCDIVFVLYDRLELEAFYETVSAILLDFWRVDDLRCEYAPIASVSDAFDGTSQWILVFTAATSLLVLGLLILLVIRERRFECSIYLALGESKLKLMAQILIEIYVISLIAIMGALSVGHMLASHLTSHKIL